MRVLLVEDHPTMRLGIKAALDLEEDVEVAGEAGETGEALKLAGELDPDVVVVDLRLRRGRDGLELCRQMKSLPDPPHVLVYTAYNTREDVQAALRCGADSYVYKGEDPAILRDAVRETCAGKKVWFLGSEVEEAYPAVEAAAYDARLTPREKEVYELVLRGYSNARIAEELKVSVSTVKTHMGHVFHKLGASCREDLLDEGPFTRGRNQHPA